VNDCLRRGLGVVVTIFSETAINPREGYELIVGQQSFSQRIGVVKKVSGVQLRTLIVLEILVGPVAYDDQTPN